ncbi:hypothetical protein RB213_012021, partial [Colletotrichum asianum]
RTHRALFSTLSKHFGRDRPALTLNCTILSKQVSRLSWMINVPHRKVAILMSSSPASGQGDFRPSIIASSAKHLFERAQQEVCKGHRLMYELLCMMALRTEMIALCM